MSEPSLIRNAQTRSTLNSGSPSASNARVGELRRHLLYERFGFSENPFGVTPNPKYLYESRTHLEARSSLIVGLECGVGFQALIAVPGMGKTTILFHTLERFKHVAQTAFLFQTQGKPGDFLSYLLSELQGKRAPSDMYGAQEAINQLLLHHYRNGRSVIIAVDEAQSLNTEVLETIRLLSNFEARSEKLLQIILAGQPQLADKLASPQLTQLHQRISMFATLLPFTLAETNSYIAHRLTIAGYSGPELFTPDAVTAIWRESHGIPRNINMLCLNALLLAGSGKAQIDTDTIAEVIAERNPILFGRSGFADPSSPPVPSDTSEACLKQERGIAGSNVLPFIGAAEQNLHPRDRTLRGGEFNAFGALSPFADPVSDAEGKRPTLQSVTAGEPDSKSEDTKTRHTVSAVVIPSGPQHPRSGRRRFLLGLCCAALVLLAGRGAVYMARRGSFSAKMRLPGFKPTVVGVTAKPIATGSVLSSPAVNLHEPPAELMAVQHFSTVTSTTITVVLGHKVQYSDFRLTSPSRIYFDLGNTVLSPSLTGKSMRVNELLVSRIRVAQHEGETTRVALVTNGLCDYTHKFVSNPNRLLIKVSLPHP